MADQVYYPIYLDNESAMLALTDEERGQLFLALFDHANGRDIRELSPAAHMAYLFMIGGIDRHIKKRKIASENGSLGGAPVGNKNNQSQPKSTKVKLTKTKKKTKKKTKRLSPLIPLLGKRRPSSRKLIH